MNRLYTWWVLDCQPLRRILGLSVSNQTLVDAYYARRPGQFGQDVADWAARQKARPRMLNCALKWEEADAIPRYRAVCWHCNQSMNPHVIRECSVAAPDIKGVIRKEEQAYERMAARAKTLLSDETPTTLTGKRLAFIHQTHGIDPSMVETIVGVLPESTHTAYAAEYHKHRLTGAARLKKAVILAS